MPDTLVAATTQTDAEISWTRREILQQPHTLRATQALLQAQADRIDAFLAPLLADPALRIILTGAGSSSFIGESLAPSLSPLLHRRVEAVATTDLVSAPYLHFDEGRPTLLVSFGRSGNSPESIAAIELAERHLRTVRHLILTCNEDGALARLELPGACILILPDATHDRGFAMTSSFTAMTYAALAIFTGPGVMGDRADAIARSVAAALADSEPRIAALAAAGFQRIVYLGSGILHGLAREAALKLMELTDGRIVTFADTPMGFRHGPKTVVTPQTLVVVFASNHPLTRRYDMDLIDELRRDGTCGAVVVVTAQAPPGDVTAAPGDVTAAPGDIIRVAQLDHAPDSDLLFPYVVPAQLLGLHAALRFGLEPDRPNASGTVNRVVVGVHIHTADP